MTSSFWDRNGGLHHTENSSAEYVEGDRPWVPVPGGYDKAPLADKVRFANEDTSYNTPLLSSMYILILATENRLAIKDVELFVGYVETVESSITDLNHMTTVSLALGVIRNWTYSRAFNLEALAVIDRLEKLNVHWPMKEEHPIWMTLKRWYPKEANEN